MLWKWDSHLQYPKEHMQQQGTCPTQRVKQGLRFPWRHACYLSEQHPAATQTINIRAIVCVQGNRAFPGLEWRFPSHAAVVFDTTKNYLWIWLNAISCLQATHGQKKKRREQGKTLTAGGSQSRAVLVLARITALFSGCRFSSRMCIGCFTQLRLKLAFDSESDVNGFSHPQAVCLQ